MTAEWCVNYEGGKIIEHAVSSNICVGYTNIQIIMDAPFRGRPANKSLRRAAKGMRAETAFAGYDEQSVLQNLKEAFSQLREINGEGIQWVIQIARGSAAKSTELELVRPALEAAAISKPEIWYGYRTVNYFKPPDTNFVLVNIGMAASLFSASKAGEICIPSTTHDVVAEIDGLRIAKSREHPDDLLRNVGFSPIHLLGIEDDMPFVTPENYPNGLETFRYLVEAVASQTSR